VSYCTRLGFWTPQKIPPIHFSIWQVHLPAEICLLLQRYDGKKSHGSTPSTSFFTLLRFSIQLTYLLTPWSRIFLEKLTVSQLVKKFPAFYGSQRFINAFTRTCHLSLSWAKISVRLRGFLCEHFVTRYVLRWAVSAPRPIPKLEDHSLSAVRDCLFNIFPATIHIGGRSSIRNLRTRHAVVTRTHLSRLPPAYFPTFLSSLRTILFAGMLVLFFASNKRLSLSVTNYVQDPYGIQQLADRDKSQTTSSLLTMGTSFRGLSIAAGTRRTTAFPMT